MNCNEIDVISASATSLKTWDVWDEIVKHAPNNKGFVCSYKDLPSALYRIFLPEGIREIIIYDELGSSSMSSCHLHETSTEILTAESAVSLVTMHKDKFGSMLTNMLVLPSSTPSKLELLAVFEPCG